MALPDDPTKVSLPQMKVPGMENPPAATPAPAAPASTADPLTSLRSAMQQVANVSKAPAPAPAPLHGPSIGSTILPTLQAADSAMRAAPQAINDNVLRPIGAGIDAAGGAVANAGRAAISAGQAENQRIQALPAGVQGNPGTIGGNTANLYNRAINAGLDSGFLSPDVVQRRGVTFPEQQQGIKPPLPQASYSNEGRVTNKDIVMPRTEPAAPAAPAAAPANRTPASDPYSGPAAGMINPNVTPTSGVEGFQRQLQNIRALSDSAPTGGFNTLADPTEAENAEKTKRWAIDDAVAKMKGADHGTQAALGKYIDALATGDTQSKIAAGNQQVQMRGQDTQQQIAGANNQVQMRGQALQQGLGMRQVGATERGQDISAANVAKQVEATLTGQQLHHDASLQQVGATLQGQQTHAATAAANVQANKEIHAADASSRERTAAQQLQANLQIGENRTLPPGVFPVGGKLYTIDKKTKLPVPFGMPAP